MSNIFKYGGPIHYLGNRLTDLPNHQGEMIPDRYWFNKMISIIKLCNKPVRRIIEPFSGSASFSLGMMEANVAEEYIINDTNTALIEYLRCLKCKPALLIDTYSTLVEEFTRAEDSTAYFLLLIDRYNNLDFHERGLILPFIVNHLWSGLIVTDKKQNIIYSPPENTEGIILTPLLNTNNFKHEVSIANTLMNKYDITILNEDFEEAIADVNHNDFIMMNPPYPENMRDEESGMYVEIHQPIVLHEKIISAIRKLNKEHCYYAMTYGFYDPDFSAFIVRHEELQRFLYLIGGKNCAFGEALDQLYLSSNISLDNIKLTKEWISIDKLSLNGCSKDEALRRYSSIIN